MSKKCCISVANNTKNILLVLLLHSSCSCFLFIAAFQQRQLSSSRYHHYHAFQPAAAQIRISGGFAVHSTRNESIRQRHDGIFWYSSRRPRRLRQQQRRSFPLPLFSVQDSGDSKDMVGENDNNSSNIGDEPQLQEVEGGAGLFFNQQEEEPPPSQEVGLYNAAPLFTGGVITVMTFLACGYMVYAGVTGDDPLAGHPLE